MGWEGRGGGRGMGVEGRREEVMWEIPRR